MEYTDFIYVFLILLTHSTIWNEQRFQTQNTTQLLALHMRMTSSTPHLFSQIGWVHCKAHEADPSIISKGNNHTNMAAYQAAFLSLMSHHTSLQATVLHNPENYIPNPPSTQDISCYMHQILHSNPKLLLSFPLSHLTLTPSHKTF